MPNKIDYTGRRFGKLLVRGESGRDRYGAVMWLCHCDCGTSANVRGSSLKQGTTQSCGCGITEAASRPKTHGGTHDPLYARWRAMIGRCTLSNSAEYHNYGGRGIGICERWDKFENFYDDMSGGFDASLELDRIDVNGDYTPENCRWVTKKEQQRNKRTNHRVEWRGETKTVQEWAELLGHKPNTLLYRIRRGWEVERAMAFCADPVLLEIANGPRCEEVI